MSPAQKFIAQKLLEGYYITPYGPHWYRLRSPEHVVVRKLSNKTFKGFKNLLRKKDTVWLINKNCVRQLHGSTFIKQQYKIKANGSRN